MNENEAFPKINENLENSDIKQVISCVKYLLNYDYEKMKNQEEMKKNLFDLEEYLNNIISNNKISKNFTDDINNMKISYKNREKVIDFLNKINGIESNLMRNEKIFEEINMESLVKEIQMYCLDDFSLDESAKNIKLIEEKLKAIKMLINKTENYNEKTDLLINEFSVLIDKYKEKIGPIK